MAGRVKGGRGYLLIDNRASGGKMQEMATMTCAHCQLVVVLNAARKRARGYCAKCHAYICDNRVCSTYCATAEQCVMLAHDTPGFPALPRTDQGGLFFDPAMLQKGRPF